MEDCMSTIRNQLNKIIAKKGVNLLIFSIECGVSYDTLKGIMYKNNDIALSTLYKISRNLRVPISFLVDEEQVRMKENKEALMKAYDILRIQVKKGGAE